MTLNYDRSLMSDLEVFVSEDMVDRGFDPFDVEDIKEYWRIVLEDDIGFSRDLH